CIPEWEDSILLCRRAIEPRLGLWTLPAGFMENAETMVQGAARETLEEANARVEMGALYAIYNLPHINQVHVLFRAQLLDLDFKPGIESLDVRLFGEAEIPWDTLAFRVIHEPLKHYFEERRQGKFGFHMGTIGEARK
ncbi:MAG: NUDIX hydrolase, partial [Nitrosospira sp.]